MESRVKRNEQDIQKLFSIFEKASRSLTVIETTQKTDTKTLDKLSNDVNTIVKIHTTEINANTIHRKWLWGCAVFCIIMILSTAGYILKRDLTKKSPEVLNSRTFAFEANA